MAGLTSLWTMGDATLMVHEGYRLEQELHFGVLPKANAETAEWDRCRNCVSAEDDPQKWHRVSENLKA